MSQQPFQAWQSQQWNYQEEPMQQQQHQHHHTLLNPAASTTHQPMQQEYMYDSNQYLLYQDLLMNSQNELEAGQQSRQDQSLLSLSQLTTDMFTSSGLPTYFISQLTNEQQMPTYVDNSILPELQPNGALFPQQNLFTFHQQHQQQWLSQFQYAGQHEEQKPNEVIMPMQSEHELSRQNSVQDMLG
ncbi:5765_t:CDS:1, partial [Paraglomus brasilianum]